MSNNNQMIFHFFEPENINHQHQDAQEGENYQIFLLRIIKN